MSTPTGQSRLQPLQDRHRSSASATSGERQPSSITLAGGHLEQQPGPPAGGVLLLAGGPVAGAHHAAVRGDALAHAEAAPGGPGERAAVVREGQRAARRASWAARRKRAGPRRGGPGAPPGRGSSGRPGPRSPLNSSNPAMISGGYIRGSSSARATPSPCSPDSEPPCATARSAASIMNARKSAIPDLGEQVEVDPDVQAAVAEVAVVGAAAAVPAQQRVELAQVGAEPLGRHRGVLPARPGLAAVGEPGHGCRRRPRGSATAPSSPPGR